MQQLHAESPPKRSEWSPARLAKYEATLGTPVQALARLEIPDVDLSVMVLEGSDDATLDRAVGHIEGTARPGEPGNLGIAGHRDGYFRALRHVEKGDRSSLHFDVGCKDGTEKHGMVHITPTALFVVGYDAPAGEQAELETFAYGFALK